MLDLTDALLADVRGLTGTAFIPESARVLRSGYYKFFDEPYIQAVHLTEKSCPEMADDGLSSFETNRSRSEVNFNVNEERPDCALVQPTKGHTMLQLDGTCATEVVAGELVEGFEFEPRCLVVVIALENEKALFDAFMSAGRIMTDPFEISVNYTIATGSDPDVKLASTNCHNSHVLMRNYELDTTGQAERDELAQVRADITMYENLITFTKNLINSQALVGPADSWGRVTLLSPKPSPPPPPPPVPELFDPYAPLHPPAPPETVSGRTLVARYEGNLLDLEAREDELVLKLNDCFVKDRAAGTVCGLNSNEAPHPFMALDGVKCRGYDTLSTREGDYCGYWESDTNPMAAESKKERQELLSVGPFCMAEVEGVEQVAYCSPNATRTQRSGVTDVEYMIRPDREYWLVCCNLNHTHTHVRIPHESHTGHPCFLLTLPPDPTQRVQVCAAAAHVRGGRRHRAVPRQPDEAHRAVPHQLRRVRRALHQQGRDRNRLGRPMLGRAAHPGHAAGAALERPGPRHRLPVGRQAVRHAPRQP